MRLERTGPPMDSICGKSVDDRQNEQDQRDCMKGSELERLELQDDGMLETIVSLRVFDEFGKQRDHTSYLQHQKLNFDIN